MWENYKKKEKKDRNSNNNCEVKSKRNRIAWKKKARKIRDLRQVKWSDKTMKFFQHFSSEELS